MDSSGSGTKLKWQITISLSFTFTFFQTISNLPMAIGNLISKKEKKNHGNSFAIFFAINELQKAIFELDKNYIS